MPKTVPERLPLPDNSVIRVIDLPPSSGAVITVSPDGFVNIYLNARFSRDGQMEALQHELRHHYRNDLYSDKDIREVERLADVPMALDGTLISDESPAFPTKDLRPVGRGAYRPTGDSLNKAAADLVRIQKLLVEAVHICDVMQRAPLIDAKRLYALAEGLCIDDLAFIALESSETEPFASLRFYREQTDRLHGALFYDARGRLNNALAIFEADNHRVTVDLRQRRGRLDVHSISRETDGFVEKLY